MKMCDLNSICFICLHYNNSLEAVVSNDAQNVSTVTEVKYVLPELATLESEIPVYICFSCRTKVQSFYMFKKRCLENYSRLIRNTKILQDTSVIQDQIISEFEKRTYNNEPMLKQEQDVGTEFNIRKEKTVVENSVVVKEEFTASEDSVDLGVDEECNPQLEFVKCEASSENEQDDGSSVDENRLKDITHIDYQDNASSHCSKNLSDNSELLKQTGFECSICSKKFELKSNLRRHMRIHSSKNEFKCPVCYKIVRQYTGLQKYNVGQTGITDLECSCDRSSTLKPHENLNEEFKCSVCSKQFTQKSYLTRHIKIHNSTTDYKCSICNKQFRLNSNLLKHMKTHSGAKNFECLVCHKRFTQNIGLRRHMVGHTGIRPFQCSKCPKKFSLKRYLQKHMKTHRESNQYRVLSSDSDTHSQ